MGRTGGTCGVVTGVLMGIGILLGRDGENDGREPSYREARRFQDEFRDRFGSLSCPVLIGLDLSRRQDRLKARALNVGQTRCVAFLEWGALSLGRLLEVHRPRRREPPLRGEGKGSRTRG